MKQETYQLLVKTNCYAGNFERELCAFMTGQVGDCEVGDEFVEEEIQKMISNTSNFILIEEPETYIKFEHI